MDIEYFDFNDKPVQRLRNLKGKFIKNLIIQRGPQLFNAKSFCDKKDFKIYTRRINLESRPASLNRSCKKILNSISPSKDNKKIENISPKNITVDSEVISPKNIKYCSKSGTLRNKFFFEQNPFQNEALKSPLSKKSISMARKCKGFLYF